MCANGESCWIQSGSLSSAPNSPSTKQAASTSHATHGCLGSQAKTTHAIATITSTGGICTNEAVESRQKSDQPPEAMAWDNPMTTPTRIMSPAVPTKAMTPWDARKRVRVTLVARICSAWPDDSSPCSRSTDPTPKTAAARAMNPASTLM